MIVYGSDCILSFPFLQNFGFCFGIEFRNREGGAKGLSFVVRPFPRVHSFLLRFVHRVEGLCMSKIVFDFFF